jgi:hypothetical protein
MTEPIEFLFGFVLPFGCFSARTCRRLDALSRKDRGLADAAARGDCHAGDGLAPLLQNACVYPKPKRRRIGNEVHQGCFVNL